MMMTIMIMNSTAFVVTCGVVIVAIHDSRCNWATTSTRTTHNQSINQAHLYSYKCR